jgi:esterase/lipase superfamily enzyme
MDERDGSALIRAKRKRRLAELALTVVEKSSAVLLYLAVAIAAFAVAYFVSRCRSIATDLERTSLRLDAVVRELADSTQFAMRSTTAVITGSDLAPDTGAIYPVWFGTNRRPADKNAVAKGFTTETDDQTHFGRVDVIVPKAHRFGETGTSFFERFLRFDLRDDRLSMRRITPLSAAEMWAELHQEVAHARDTGNTSEALLFIHGYNTSFADAAIRAAQIGFDLKVTGGTAFFSWPSIGVTDAYAADEATIEASEAAMTKFIVDFAQQTGADRLHLIAHSMGNRGLLRSLQRIASDAQKRSKVHFSEIFLAAPDVDRRLFLDLAHLYPTFADRTTLYASNRDLPIFLSGKLHEAARAGYFLPYTVANGIDTIAVPNFNVDLLGHGYFAEAEALLYDIHELMRTDTPPRLRQRIEPLVDGNDALWRFRR